MMTGTIARGIVASATAMFLLGGATVASNGVSSHPADVSGAAHASVQASPAIVGPIVTEQAPTAVPGTTHDRVGTSPHPTCTPDPAVQPHPTEHAHATAEHHDSDPGHDAGHDSAHDAGHDAGHDGGEDH